ncbi:IS66 family insertion sequence element accessory protein TnpB [Pseudomonas putida]|uniref:IS66 family insertion sequence element accessory protein TnpB n=2 Tax=Pseudomonas putida TaxID=303 RepID=UPI0021195FC4|nr:IS66 family insertion sequence element accessory protein TnpB [Pseudomonas putida]
MIRIDAIWLATETMDMRAGTETALARVIAVFGAAKPHCAYLFANRRANRMKVLVHDGVGVWLAARRLNQGKFHWPGIRHGCEVELDSEQLQYVGTGFAVAASRRGWRDQHAVIACHLTGLLVVVSGLLWHNRRHDFLAQPRPDDPGTASCLGGTGVAVAVPSRGDEQEDPER